MRALRASLPRPAPRPSGGRAAPALVLAALTAVFLAASCATVPPPAGPADWLDVLPPESTLFAAFDMAAARDVLDRLAVRQGLEEGQVREALRRTHRTYAGLSSAPGAPGGFSVVALGDFGPAALELRLSFDRRWRKRTLREEGPAEPRQASCAAGAPGGEGRPAPSPWLPRETYWEHADSGLQLASPSSGILFLSNGGVPTLLRRFAGAAGLSLMPVAPLPAEARADLGLADIFVFFPRLQEGQGVQELSRLPISSLWLAARAGEADYGISAVFVLEEGAVERTGVSERALERLFRLLIPLLLRRGRVEDPVAKLRALELSVSSSQIRVDNLRLTADEAMGLLEGFAPPEGTGGGWGR